MGKELEFGFIKDTAEEYERKRKEYKQITKEHNPGDKYYDWKWEMGCKCKECDEAYKYRSIGKGYDTSFCVSDHPKSALYTKDSMKEYLIKCLGKGKYDTVKFLATILEEWENEWDEEYITCKIKYK